MINVQNLSDAELDELRRAVSSEQLLRRRLDASPEKIEHAIAEYQKASGKGTGEQWEQPVTALQAFRKGAEVEDEGEEWISTVNNNVWKPGVSGWKLKPKIDPETGEEIPPRYTQRSGEHDAYEQGERITWTDGHVYEAVRDGVVHSPDEYAPDWKLIEPEPEPEDPEEPEEPGEDEDEPTEPEPDEPELPEWEVGYDYSTGDEFTYEGDHYKVLQGHTSAAHWLPPDVASLYERQ